MAEEEEDQEVIESAESDLITLQSTAKIKKAECLFSGEADSNSCFIEIHAGAGGTESHDWAEMLYRMYSRWAEQGGFKLTIADYMSGEEAGIKSATLKISGHNAYGWLKSESGVHRLVRISPFNAAGKRHTSFASIWIYPQIDNSIDIEIIDSELRIDTYRASGAGGQHVNTTDSAVRITHIPTGIVAQCQNGRSQHKNKEECLSMLKSRLYEAELQKREQEANASNATKTDIGWGHQIRSYVLHPYQQVKDLRTGHTRSDATTVLNGDIQDFMLAMLEKQMAGKGLNNTN